LRPQALGFRLTVSQKNFSEDATPGWLLLHHLSPNRDAYLLSLTTGQQVQPSTLANDESGVIYFGVLPRHLQPESYVSLSQSYAEFSPLQAPDPTTSQRILGWARRLAKPTPRVIAPVFSSCKNLVLENQGRER
jgi:hypothetical protein